jgi:glycosyltransferase involved in cell wall biosynthesis
VLGVVVPVYNEEEAFGAFVARLRPVLDGLGEDYEVLVVDDGSTDATPAVLAEHRRTWPRLRVVRLRRNAGHQAALTAGLDRCDADHVVTIDADLQDPPELIPTLLAAARRDDADVVYAARDDRRSDSVFKRATAAIYYRAVRRFAGPSVPSHAGDYRLISRDVVMALRELPERHRVYRLLIPWLGFPSTTVTYRRDPRVAGESKYPVSRMARLAVDSVTSFTAQPLRIATWLGVLGSAVCLLAMLAAVGSQLVGATIPGWASVFVAVLFVGAVQLLCLGLLGEYVGRLFAEAQHRPLYFVASDTGERTPPGVVDLSARARSAGRGVPEASAGSPE